MSEIPEVSQSVLCLCEETVPRLGKLRDRRSYDSRFSVMEMVEDWK